MTQIAELNEKHAALIKQVREIRDAHTSEDMPADKAAEMEHLLDEADGVKAQLEALVSAAETKRRLDDHAAWATQSAGQLPGMGTPRTDDGKWLPGVWPATRPNTGPGPAPGGSSRASRCRPHGLASARRLRT